MENDGIVHKEYQENKKFKNDSKITKAEGKTSLYEFPKFINVLKGEMSLVDFKSYLPQ
jgi:lipopolysaccharide/colanic/teichoic acid biosynthesis glycosyltransferase